MQKLVERSPGACHHGNVIGTCGFCLKESKEAVQRQADNVLKTLGFEWEDLMGKRVLEIGAGLAELSQAAKEKGIEVIALEKNPNMWEEEGELPTDVQYLTGNAQRLPFESGSLDVVISKAAPPTISSTKEEVSAVVREVVRVLKEEGIFRFGPGYLNAAIFEPEELFTAEEEERFSLAERQERIKTRSLELLQSIYPHIKELQTGGERFVYELTKHEI